MDAEALARAVEYPYARPAGSYVVDVRTGTAAPLDVAALDPRGRVARLAIGSNAAPAQLQRKLGAVAGSPTVPVVAVELRDHDVVYAAGLAGYGAVPATVVPSPGTRVAVHVTLLDREQLAVVDRSEAVGRAYAVVPIADDLVVAPIALPPPVEAYVAIAGPALAGDHPVALAAVTATGRRWPARTEREILTALASRHDLGLAAFVARVVGDDGYRAEVAADLRAGGMPAPA